jgi:hypothetical protein
MVCVVMGRDDAVMAWVIVVTLEVFVSTARVLGHPCTMFSGKQTFLPLSKA